MIQNIILGSVQGIAEWLPVSSEGIITLLSTNVFTTQSSLEEIVGLALFLHFGTFLAALIYFRKDVLTLLQNLISYKSASQENQRTLVFLIVATLISGLLGFGILKIISFFENSLTSTPITLLVGVALLVTGILLLQREQAEGKLEGDLSLLDGVLLGLTQACAVIPGLSRSGLTVSVLLMRGFDDKIALRLSFLLSLPIVFLGNILLNASYFSYSLKNLLGLLFSFLFGLLTIHLLMRLAQKIRFGYFVIIFSLLVFVSIVL